MKRGQFIKQSSLIAFGLAAYGNISWLDNRFVGDSPTTTDILGPFYRPGAPLRTNLNPKDYTGPVLQLSGKVYKQDGKTPSPNCNIEIWQCKSDGYYDNLSDEYSYRGRTKTGNDGAYRFITAQPPPEPTDDTKTIYRPAHIHLRISATGQQDLITQIYFRGDEQLPLDPSTKSPLATARILTVKQLNEKESEIRFDVVLGKELTIDKDVFNQVCGLYKMNDGSLMEFYKDGDLLFYKIAGQIWGALSYNGNNSFVGMNTQVTFVPEENGEATLHYEFLRRRETRLEGRKILNYARR